MTGDALANRSTYAVLAARTLNYHELWDRETNAVKSKKYSHSTRKRLVSPDSTQHNTLLLFVAAIFQRSRLTPVQESRHNEPLNLPQDFASASWADGADINRVN